MKDREEINSAVILLPDRKLWELASSFARLGSDCHFQFQGCYAAPMLYIVPGTRPWKSTSKIVLYIQL